MKQNLAHNQSQLATTTPGNHAVSFRAPPPSPVAPDRRYPFANEDVLNEYLEQSLTVPDLILPDRAFPKQESSQSPPRIDFQNLCSPENESIPELIEKTGCLEVINHGISLDLIKLVLFLASGIFEIEPEMKKKVAEKGYGFEEFRDEDADIRDESHEEFLWCEDEEMRLEMEGLWPHGYSNFSREMEKLHEQIEEVGTKIMRFLNRNKLSPGKSSMGDQDFVGKLCYIQKHCRKVSENSLRNDVIRMLIRGFEFPHAVCLHVCSGSTDFHVYSKRGWLSFSPHHDSIVITLGDELQDYKHVIGRPVFKGGNERCISMGFMLSRSNLKVKGSTISVNQQIVFGVLITVIYQFLSYVYCLLFKR